MSDSAVKEIRQSYAQTSPAVSLLTEYQRIRQQTVTLAAPLTPEDCAIQSMPDASPTKWHLAHTTWFFETFILSACDARYQPHHANYNFLFNSYYNAVGERWQRAARGLLSRPTLTEVMEYRRVIDERMTHLLMQSPDRWRNLEEILILGLHHEQQHQELLLTDIKHLLASNPLHPAYRADGRGPTRGSIEPLRWHLHESGLASIGFAGAGFSFDNETPRHQVYTQRFEIASRLVTVGEYLAFMEDGGYQRPEFWLSDGWKTCQNSGWRAPLYWFQHDNRWWQVTLRGAEPVNDAEPICHVSFYEADAYARWSQARLPTEAEWEIVAAPQPIRGNLLESDQLHPLAAAGSGQWFGDVWEWTASPYVAYPGYRPPPGALGEYNGKFMCNQMVLRGGSCATPTSHIRATYRNFFPPDARWQFSGIRLARDPQ